MGVIESFFVMIAKWFGYVGACLVVPDATCRPFMAFVALGAAACAALTLVLLAYRAAQAREQTDTPQPQERARRIPPEPRLVAKPAVQPRFRAAA